MLELYSGGKILLTELPTYLAVAEDVSSQTEPIVCMHSFAMETAAILVHSLNRFSLCTKMAAVAVAKLLLWWKSHENWTKALRLVLLVQPSLAAAENFIKLVFFIPGVIT